MTPSEFAKEVMDMLERIHERLDALERKVHQLPENVVLDHTAQERDCNTENN